MATIKDQKSKIKSQKEQSEFPKNSQKIPEQTPKTHKSPRIYRFITERRFFVLISSVSLIIGILLVGNHLSHAMKEKQQLDQKRLQIELQIHTWQQIMQSYPDYRDGYFMLATLEYQLGDNAAASLSVGKTLQLDPNFKQALALEKILQIKKIGEK